MTRRIPAKEVCILATVVRSFLVKIRVSKKNTSMETHNEHVLPVVVFATNGQLFVRIAKYLQHLTIILICHFLTRFGWFQITLSHLTYTTCPPATWFPRAGLHTRTGPAARRAFWAEILQQWFWMGWLDSQFDHIVKIAIQILHSFGLGLFCFSFGLDFNKLLAFANETFGTRRVSLIFWNNKPAFRFKPLLKDCEQTVLKTQIKCYLEIHRLPHWLFEESVSDNQLLPIRSNETPPSTFWIWLFVCCKLFSKMAAIPPTLFVALQTRHWKISVTMSTMRICTTICFLLKKT